MQLRLERLPQAKGDVGIFGGVSHGIVDRDPVERHLRLARPQKRLDRDRQVAKIALGQVVHAVVMRPGVHRVRHQHGVVERGDADAEPGKDLPVVFHVLADLQDGRVFQKGL